MYLMSTYMSVFSCLHVCMCMYICMCACGVWSCTIDRYYQYIERETHNPPNTQSQPPTQVRVPTNIICSITDDRGDEPTYNGVKMSQLIETGATVGDVISLVWFQRALPKYASRFIEMCVVLCADHGPCVSGMPRQVGVGYVGGYVGEGGMFGACIQRGDEWWVVWGWGYNGGVLLVCTHIIHSTQTSCFTTIIMHNYHQYHTQPLSQVHITLL